MILKLVFLVRKMEEILLCTVVQQQAPKKTIVIFPIVVENQWEKFYSRLSIVRNFVLKVNLVLLIVLPIILPCFTCNYQCFFVYTSMWYLFLSLCYLLVFFKGLV
jgi:hypothetical protein